MNRNNKSCTRPWLLYSLVFRGIMILSIALAIGKQDWAWVVAVGIGLFISFIPSIIQQDITLSLPWIFDFLIALISILHIGGRLLDYYQYIPGYQLVTQFFIAVLVAFLSLTIIYILDEHWEGLIMDRSAMAFVTIICTMTFGVIIEFIKWLNITGTYYQKTNQALMMNLSVDTFAGVVIAIIGVNLIKKGIFTILTDEFGEQIDELLIHRLQQHDDD